METNSAPYFCCNILSALDFLGEAVGSIQSQLPRIVTGEGLGSLSGEQEAQNIHKENLERLQSMSKEQIWEEQKRLMAQLGKLFLLTYLSTIHTLANCKSIYVHYSFMYFDFFTFLYS